MTPTTEWTTTTMADSPHECRNGSSIDVGRSRLLDDVGGSHFLCMVIGPDGDEVLALVDEDAMDSLAPFQPDDWRVVAPHELTGRLPKSYAPRCGRPASAKGRPCRRLVTVHGDTCEGHQHLAHIAPAPYTTQCEQGAGR